jgi:hypothetical protein
MNSKTIPFAFILVLCLMQALVFAQRPRKISIRVVDERDKSVEGAEVCARYLATIHEGNKEYRVPIELAAPQTTDANGRCKMILQDVSWSLAAIEAHRPGMKTEDAIKLYDDAPTEPSKLEAFEREVKDLVERYSTAHRLLDPEMDANQLITLRMKKTIKVTGRVHVDGKPLAKALISIFSPQTQIDQLFPRSSPSLTDETGRFSFYSIPGELNRARVVVERANGNRVLDLTGVSAQPTPDGLRFEFETIASDYLLK